jgi:hypothetical protein
LAEGRTAVIFNGIAVIALLPLLGDAVPAGARQQGNILRGSGRRDTSALTPHIAGALETRESPLTLFARFQTSVPADGYGGKGRI